MLRLRCPVYNSFFRIVWKQNCLFRLILVAKDEAGGRREGKGERENEADGKDIIENALRRKIVKYEYLKRE
jgi:hypothetical protein